MSATRVKERRGRPTDRTARRAAGRRLLADPGRSLRLDAARRPRRRGGQGRVAGRRRHPHLAAAGARRRGDVLPRRQPQQALGRPRPQGRRRRRARPGAGRPRRHHDGELPAGRARALRPRLRHRRRRQPAGRLRLDQRLRYDGPGPRAARLRPDRAGDVGPDEPDRQPGHRALPLRHLGLRRDGRPARHDRHPRRAARPRRDRPRSARRGQPALLGAVRDGQPDECVRRRRRRTRADGQQPPEPVPLRAAACAPTAT